MNATSFPLLLISNHILALVEGETLVWVTAIVLYDLPEIGPKLMFVAANLSMWKVNTESEAIKDPGSKLTILLGLVYFTKGLREKCPLIAQYAFFGSECLSKFSPFRTREAVMFLLPPYRPLSMGSPFRIYGSETPISYIYIIYSLLK